MSDYDRWLEKPYADAARHEAAFEKFCEDEGLDYDDPAVGARFQAFLDDSGEAG